MVSLVLVSGLSMLGILFVSISEKNLRKVLLLMVSFAVGGLFGDAFFELIPESYERLGTGLGTSSLILAGVLAFFVLEKFIRWRHCHEPDCEGHAKPVVFVNIVGDAAHNFTDGLIIGASYLVDFHVGLTTTLAVILHEIPHEIGDFGVLVQGGLTPRKAVIVNFLTAVVAVVGGAVALLIGSQNATFANYLLPLTAGGFLYIAGSDLIPELHHDEKMSHAVLQLLCMVAGMAMMAVLVAMER
ncbi:MAG: ZIP family metal transporter [Verrucomicrobia bacterium]|nr:ZIP family metal transporter [Verrucomicrobiota bacterium]